MDRQERGRRGEAAAAKYYLDRGCRLLAHGYRTRQGELDLILEDRGVIVVAEVKTRASAPCFPGRRRWMRQSSAAFCWPRSAICSKTASPNAR